MICLKTNEIYLKFKDVFLEQNKILNLISKNDEKFLFEKHFYDSLAIKLFFEKYSAKPKTILDIGTGGGFPSIPIALFYPLITVTALDSIRKKINAVSNIKSELCISNLKPLCCRAESITDKQYDIITSRAVGKLSQLIIYSNLLKPNGYFVIYKSKTADEELFAVKNILNKYHLKFIDTIDYTLPLDEIFNRKLVILKKVI